MPTLKSILMANHGFTEADFADSDGYVRVDLGRQLLASRAGATVQLDQLFSPRQRVTLKPGPERPHPMLLQVLSVGEGGLKAMDSFGTASFIPWQVLSFALSHPDQVLVDRPAVEI